MPDQRKRTRHYRKDNGFYLYDADGTQLIRRNPGTSTLSLGSDELTVDTATKTQTGTRYYPIPGGMTIVRKGAGTAAGTFTVQIADHQGTNNLSIDLATLAASRRPADPFGNPRGTQPAPGTWLGTKGFVGGMTDKVTGLVHLGAREYDPTTGRFISVDPILDLTDPQQVNGYAYSNNNPINLSDPTGLKSEECGTLYQCGQAGTITMKNAAESTANYVSASALQRLDQTLPGADYYEAARQTAFGPKPAGSQRVPIKTPRSDSGDGIIMVRFYIHMEKTGMAGLFGDNRSWSNFPVDSARMALFWDTETGEASFTIMPSTEISNFTEDQVKRYGRNPTPYYAPPREIPAKEILMGDSTLGTDWDHKSTVKVNGASASSIDVSIHGINSKLKVFGVDNTLKVNIGPKGYVQVTRNGDPYPDMEVVQYRQGRSPNVIARDAMAGHRSGDPGMNAIPVLGEKLNRTYEEGRCISRC
ncbi:RHS repeat-associated core domain-containing protein [Kitasatospora sp. NPDC092286]|uniref:RHS repeat-associated core domain-containing protein n=1 Tax=Kitasatospora sp. NPDC092286 TaxID=3364087 RepID=UPI003814A31F